MLIDVLRAVGLERMAQVDLGTRQNRHQSLSELVEDGAGGAGRGRAPHPRRPARRGAPGKLHIPGRSHFEPSVRSPKSAPAQSRWFVKYVRSPVVAGAG